MKKHTSKEAYYDRLRNLAEVNKKSIHESSNGTLGTLIDYKKASNGVNYGIVKESHNYYIKKGGIKNNPDVSDFAYIGGLSNITNYQYKSLHEADKMRNMMLTTINEATNLRPNINGGKKVTLTEEVSEDKAGEEIDNAESKLDDLDAATAAAETEPTSDEISAGLESEPNAGEEGGGEEPVDVNVDADGLPDVGGEEGEDNADVDVDIDVDDNAEGGDKDEPTRELEKSIGKLTNNIRKTELTDSQVKSYLKSLIQSFKDKLPDLEIEDRKEIANLILKVVPPEDIEDLGNSMPDEEIEEEKCNECGSFAQYAESRGYDSADALMECGDDEVSNLVSGYANAHNDGMNDGDLDNVALIIKVVNPNVLDSLKNDYGHDEYAEKLTPYVDGMTESSDEDNLAKLNELFGGLKSVGNWAKQGVTNAANKAGQAVKNKVQQGVQAVGDKVQQGVQAYHGGEVAGEVQKLEKYANNLGAQVAALNNRLTKAGQQPIDVNKLIAGITNQVRAGKNVNVRGTTAGSGLKEEEGLSDPANVAVQPNIREEEDNSDVKNDNVGFAADSQPLGGGVIKPDGAPTSGVDINVTPDKSVNISMSETIKKMKEAINEISDKVGQKGKTTTPKGDKFLSHSKNVKESSTVGEGNKFTKKLTKTPKGGAFKIDGETEIDTSNYDDKSVKDDNKEMNETELKVRKYIRKRLEEKIGLRKSTINEDAKSESLKKLDKMIDEQFNSYKKVIKK